MHEQPNPDGWEIPIHQSLTSVTLTAGINRNVAVLLWSITLMVVMKTWAFHLVLISAAVHMALAYVTKTDHHFLTCLMRSLKYGKFYE